MSRSRNRSIGVSRRDTKNWTRRIWGAGAAALAGAMLMSFAVGCGDDGVSGNGGGNGGGGNGGGGNGGGGNGGGGNNNPVLAVGEAWTLCDHPELWDVECAGMIFNANGTATIIIKIDGVWYHPPYDDDPAVTYRVDENRIRNTYGEDGWIEFPYTISGNTLTVNYADCEFEGDYFSCGDGVPWVYTRTQNVNPIPLPDLDLPPSSPDNLFKSHTNSDQIFGKRSSRNR